MILLSVCKINCCLAFEALVLIAGIFLLGYVTKNQWGKWYRYGAIAIVAFLIGLITFTLFNGLHRGCGKGRGGCDKGGYEMRMMRGHGGMGGNCGMMMGGGCGMMMGGGMNCCMMGGGMGNCGMGKGHCEMGGGGCCKEMSGCDMKKGCGDMEEEDDDCCAGMKEGEEHHGMMKDSIKKEVIIKKK